MATTPLQVESRPVSIQRCKSEGGNKMETPFFHSEGLQNDLNIRNKPGQQKKNRLCI